LAARKRAVKDDQVYAQPSTRIATRWTPALIRAAELSADGGSLRAAADCFDWVLTDERCRGVFETRVGSLLGAPIEFEDGAKRARIAKRVLRALEAQEDWWDMLPEASLLMLMVWGLGLGVGLGELFPWSDKNSRIVPTLRWWHPRWLRYDYSIARWMLTVGGNGGGPTSEIQIEPGDRRWVLYCPFGNEAPWRFGLWRGVSRFRLLKSLAIDDWGRHSETAARIFIEGLSAEVEISKQVRKELADDIENAGSGQIVALPGGVTAKLIELTANTRDIYQAQIDCANLAYAVGVLGQNMTTEIRGGSFAASQTSSEVEARRIRYDAEVGSTILHDQVLVPWSEVNFGSAELAPWPRWMVEPPKDTVKWASTLSQAIPPLLALEKRFTDAGLPSPVDWEVEFKELGIPVVEGYKFKAALEEPEPPAPPPGNPTPPPAEEDEQRGKPPPPEPSKNGAPRPKALIELVGSTEIDLRAASESDADRHGVSVQDWTDTVNREAAQEATEVLREDVAQLLEDIRRAGTWTILRDNLIRRLGRMDAAELAKTLHEPLTLLQIAGRASELEAIEQVANWPKIGKEAGRWQKAIDLLRRKTNLTRADFDLLDAAARTRAFTVANVTNLDLISEIHDSLVKAEQEQKRFEEWRDQQRDKLAEAWELGGGPRTPDHIAWRLETIWRTNTQAALNAGRYAQQVDPDILALRPYWYLVVVDDERTSDICREFVSPKVILPASDPFWSTHYPPLHYACRDRVTTLDAEQARAKGVLVAPPSAEAQKGFGAAPGVRLPEWEPDLSGRDPELAKVTREKLADVPKPPPADPLTRKLPAKYDPEHWLAHYRDERRYDEDAARALAHGRVALERGLDMQPAEVAERLRMLGPRFEARADLLDRLGKERPGLTVRQLKLLASPEHDAVRASAAVAGHCARVRPGDPLGLTVENPDGRWPGDPRRAASDAEAFLVRMADRSIDAPRGWHAELGWLRGEMRGPQRMVRSSPANGELEHELAHAFEYLNPRVHRACVAFLRARTRGEALRNLAEFDAAYRDSEMTRPDKFFDPYVGKDYREEHTEVLSMAMQWVITGDAAQLLVDDPEHLYLLLGCLSGRL